MPDGKPTLLAHLGDDLVLRRALDKMSLSEVAVVPCSPDAVVLVLTKTEAEDIGHAVRSYYPPRGDEPLLAKLRAASEGGEL